MTDHVGFVIALTPSGRMSKVIKDGVDISGEITGIEVSSMVGEATRVTLHYLASTVAGTVDEPLPE